MYLKCTAALELARLACQEPTLLCTSCYQLTKTECFYIATKFLATRREPSWCYAREGSCRSKRP